MMRLRDYQLALVQKARRAVSSGKRRILVVLPTGGGKTIVAGEIVSGAIQKGSNVLFLVHRRELAYQALERFNDFGIGGHVGLIMAGEQSNLSRPIQVASIQTYIRRLQLDDPQFNVWFHRANVVVFDEAHCSIAPSFKSVLELYKDRSVILGLTATPCRGDGRGLGEMYEQIVSGADIAELTRERYLVPMVYYAPHTPDLKKIRTVGGDYCKKELASAMDKPKLVGDIYENWARIAPDRQTIIFATNVKHSQHIKQVFENRGVSIEHLDSHTPNEQRAEILQRLRSGETQVVTNCQILTEGFDFPGAGCIVIARPTKSLGLYRQMAGRGLRPFPEKTDCILLDHSGCIANHGFIDETVQWCLDGRKRAWKRTGKKAAEKYIMTCEMCCASFTGPRCPICGTEVKQYGKKIAAIEAELVRIGKGTKQVATMADKKQFYAMLEHQRQLKGYSPGWSAHKYREKFGVWPQGMGNVSPMPPDKGFLNWQKYQTIRYAKRRSAEVSHA